MSTVPNETTRGRNVALYFAGVQKNQTQEETKMCIFTVNEMMPKLKHIDSFVFVFSLI